jgi:hypothetical protein
MSSVALKASERRLLQHVRHHVAEGIGQQAGWARVGFPLNHSWDWNDVKALVGRGLLERADLGKHVYVRPTEAGWAA